jgi:IS30 family transposase
MALVKRMDIFSLLYGERLKPSAIAAALNRQTSSITRELEKDMDKGSYNPILPRPDTLKPEEISVRALK